MEGIKLSLRKKGLFRGRVKTGNKAKKKEKKVQYSSQEGQPKNQTSYSPKITFRPQVEGRGREKKFQEV